MLMRYTADLLNGVPSIVIGIFAWTHHRGPLNHFSAWAGGIRVEPDDDPDRAAQHRTIPARRARIRCAKGALALGASKEEHDYVGDRSRGANRASLPA